VLQRYLNRGIEILRSDAHGAILLRLRPGQPPAVTRHRVDVPRYWRVLLDGPDAAPVGDTDETEPSTRPTR
jgi:hypothetical protein